ncbi:pimeloyl-CoA dehydrogenase small subunit [Gordonia sp. TBRC 11910]|uniref:Pimeloyl-CoA dehydrogenase small subunit n=1 Tax=Gordonia asplenii TaxID=2725283 RepID=A0A848KYP2_9ACTN|nr:acyl-CoA dehydrogenase family protein [Gordonia asplenii]NMO01523.1 pimeloyl-CoA dehydrogenase small subunit [Gordonia asplenii]
MDFTLTAEQQLLRDGLTKFLATRYDLDVSRAAVKTGAGWQPDIWQAFADELGILGATIPEAAGGMGGSATELMVIAEALGHGLVVEPYVDTVVVAAGLLERVGGDPSSELLEKIAAGGAVVALAAVELDSGDPREIATTAVRDGDDWVLTGAKIVVTSAPLASHLLITAQTDAGPALFLTDFDAAAPAPGLGVHSFRTVDDRLAADLTFDGLRLPAASLLTDSGVADLVDEAFDRGAAAVCAEALGAMRRVLDDTVAYCKQRQQFGQSLGSFQALQHRMVDMLIEVEQSSAAVVLAVLNLDAAAADRARAVSAAKVTLGRAARFVGQNAVQLHGGMGMTEELAVGHYFKRLTAVQYEFGSTDFHLDRYARLTRPLE